MIEKKFAFILSKNEPLTHGYHQNPELSIPAKVDVCMVTLNEVLENKSDNVEWVYELGEKVHFSFCVLWTFFFV